MPEKLKLGLIVNISDAVDEAFRAVADLGLQAIQLAAWNPATLSAQLAEKVRSAGPKHRVTVSSVWAGFTGPCVWNFTEGPSTIGLVPPQWRSHRVAELKKGADFAKQIGAPSITTHVGFIPENPADPEYKPTVAALKDVAGHCRSLGLGFWFETGQETPVTLLRTITDIGLDNLGINLDPANLVLYGKANPVDALDVFGKYVKGVHAKDGRYPTNGNELGHETAVGQGKVDFKRLLPDLKKLGFNGAVIIEREISGPQQTADIKASISYLTPLL
jgi:sugar phosphate isomerase/epimerase